MSGPPKELEAVREIQSILPLGMGESEFQAASHATRDMSQVVFIKTPKFAEAVPGQPH